MTLKDVIEALVHYSLNHITMPPPDIYHREAKELAGYCDHDKAAIYIDTEMGLMDKRQVIIHELAHAINHCKGISDEEDTIDIETIVTFKELYPDYQIPDGTATRKKR